MTANELPWRVLIAPAQTGGLPQEEHTIAELLKPLGYMTGMSGKWHLGLGDKKDKHVHLPSNHGFDSYLGIPFTNMPYCKQGKEMKEFCMVMANHTIVEQPTIYSNLTSVITNHAIDFISRSVSMETPFFFFMSFVHVHTPLFTSPAFTNVSRGGRFGDNVEEMDWSVGQILASLDRLNIRNNTLVVFVSDNGPYLEEGWDEGGRTNGLKGGKGQTYEGGIRVPGIVRWPSVVPPRIVSDSLIGSLVILPSLTHLILCRISCQPL